MAVGFGVTVPEIVTRIEAETVVHAVDDDVCPTEGESVCVTEPESDAVDDDENEDECVPVAHDVRDGAIVVVTVVDVELLAHRVDVIDGDPEPLRDNTNEIVDTVEAETDSVTVLEGEPETEFVTIELVDAVGSTLCVGVSEAVAVVVDESAVVEETVGEAEEEGRADDV